MITGGVRYGGSKLRPREEYAYLILMFLNDLVQFDLIRERIDGTKPNQ